MCVSAVVWCVVGETYKHEAYRIIVSHSCLDDVSRGVTKSVSQRPLAGLQGTKSHRSPSAFIGATPFGYKSSFDQMFLNTCHVHQAQHLAFLLCFATDSSVIPLF